MVEKLNLAAVALFAREFARLAREKKWIKFESRLALVNAFKDNGDEISKAITFYRDAMAAVPISPSVQWTAEVYRTMGDDAVRLDHAKEPDFTAYQLDLPRGRNDPVKTARAIIATGPNATYPARIAAQHVRDIMKAILDKLDAANRATLEQRHRAQDQESAVLRLERDRNNLIGVNTEASSKILELGRKVEELHAEAERLRNACAKQDGDVQQVLGKVLGFPRFADDQQSFPGSTEADGVCVGEHTGASLADEAVKTIKYLRDELRLSKDKIRKMTTLYIERRPGAEAVGINTSSEAQLWSELAALTDSHGALMTETLKYRSIFDKIASMIKDVEAVSDAGPKL
jgi:hypothetical protein